MLWDFTPLSYCDEQKDKDELYAALVEVMGHAISLDSVACIESGLHGLGHIEHSYKPAGDVVKQFIDTKGHELDEDLLQYARMAQKGYVQ